MVDLSVAVVLFGAVVWPAAPPAGADPVTSARAQAAALQQEVTASASRIRALTLAYEQANTEAGALSQQVASDRAEIAQLESQVSSTAAALRADAIISYTGGSVSTQSDAVGSDDPAVRAEYLQLAAGDLSDTVDQYRTQAGELASAEAGLATEMRASEAAVSETDSARQAALAQATATQAQLLSVQAQLSQLEAAEAARAVSEAARAAAEPVRTATGPAPRPAAAEPAQGVPVEGGLVAAVRSVVSPAPQTTASGGNAGGVWLQLRECESGDNYRANTGNGFYGAYQFSAQTWANLGYPGRPDLEPPAMQDEAAQKLQSESGWGQWPACSAALGLH